jgi:hypothetical protein
MGFTEIMPRWVNRCLQLSLAVRPFLALPVAATCNRRGVDAMSFRWKIVFVVFAVELSAL